MKFFVLALVFALPAQIQGAILTFQEGVNGYVGTLDTQLRLASSNINAAAATSLIAHNGDPAVPPGPAQILLRFDNIFGTRPGQLPYGSLIRRAELILSSSFSDAQTSGPISLHRLLQDWTEDCTWASCFGGDGVQLDAIETISIPDATFIPNFPEPSGNGTQRITNDVTISMQAWSSGQANFGWVMINSSEDDYRMDSSEDPTPANRPLLRVVIGECLLSFTQFPSNAVVRQCGTAMFMAQVIGIQPIRLQWNKDGSPIGAPANPSAATSTLVLTNVQETDEGIYTLTAQGQCPEPLTSTGATLTVLPDTQPPTLIRAISKRDGVTISITFSEPMNDAAADSLNYRICKIANANDCLPLNTTGVFSSDRTMVTFTSAIPRSASAAYEVRAERMADQCAANLISSDSTVPLSLEFPGLCISLDTQPGGAKLVRIVWPCPAGSPPATGFALESADEPDGPWTPVNGATSPYLIPPDTARQFYRLSD